MQFSLRTSLLVVLLASAGMSWLVVKVQQAGRQRQAVEAIRALGGFVTYDYAIDQAYGHPVNAQDPGPGWLGSVLGVDFFADVVRVNLDSTDVTDAQLEHLENLPQLRWVNLFNTRITDSGLEHLQRLRHLERLELGGTQVTDAGLEYLEGLPDLQSVYATDVTEKGMERLHHTCPQLNW